MYGLINNRCQVHGKVEINFSQEKQIHKCPSQVRKHVARDGTMLFETTTQAVANYLQVFTCDVGPGIYVAASISQSRPVSFHFRKMRQ